MEKFVRVTKGLYDFGKLIEEDKVFDLVDNIHDWYQSVFYYNKEHLDRFKETGKVKGIKDTFTDKIYFDFDSKDDLKEARDQAITVINRLVDYGIKPQDLDITFSGNKGFNIVLNIDKFLSPKEVESICEKFAGDLSTFDTSMYDSNQLLRIVGTKHQKSGLFKIPLTWEELNTTHLNNILQKARNIDWIEDLSYPVISPPDEFYKIPVKETPKLEKKLNNDIRKELINKPSSWKDYKWLLLQGYFDSGERHNALMVIAATARGMGYDKETVYYMCKSALKKQAERYNQEEFPKEELWTNIIESVFDDGWEGGQYSAENNLWLKKYAEKMGLDPEEQVETDPVQIKDIESEFQHFVDHIEENTVKTGIPWLDKQMPLTIGMNLGLIGAASSGKTAIALEILKNTSQAGVISVFASLDMHRKRLYEKLLYKASGKSRDEIYQMYREGRGHEISASIEKDYGNVWFYDRSCPTVYDIREYILNVQKKTGKKVKMLMVDYFERVNSDKSEDTAASKEVAGKLQDLVNDLDICLITLVQPNKFSLGGGPDSPILSYTAIKGSSFLYQSFRSIVSIWRPFFNPETFENDKYMEMAILKNDLGELGKNAFGWEGKTGDIYELTGTDREKLAALLKEKANSKKEDKDGWE